MAELDFPTWNVAYSLIGGILPALFWLWFWVQEDKLHPEPRGRLLAAFIGGMAIVPLAYLIQKSALHYFGDIDARTLLVWATAEELLKYIAVGFVALRSRDYDEPIDAMVYLVTTALGFAALENTLFILNPLIAGGHGIQGIITGNERFLGASLLHVVCSAMLGYCIGREFYRTRLWKLIWRVFGISLAICIHTVFNFFILYENGANTFVIFSVVWMLALVILLLFEKIKVIRKQ